ncbi:hypothetical protein C9I43_02325 [Shewanella morhuae]|uniref:Uncharacterized protein n=1 Tax=Shewanella morhuae TaxID=365591 RepID=A0ABX5HSL1_9GAMM|nr:hypothetical protein C9I43_02325 [Shewanella morhuae]
MATRFILRLRLSTEHHYAFKPSPCLKRVELPLNEQIVNTIGIIANTGFKYWPQLQLVCWAFIAKASNAFMAFFFARFCSYIA